MNVNCFYKIYSAELTLHIPNWALHMTYNIRLFTNYICEIFRPHFIICLGGIRSIYLLISRADHFCLHSCEPFSILENQRIVWTSGRGHLSDPLLICLLNFTLKQKSSWHSLQFALKYHVSLDSLWLQIR